MSFSDLVPGSMVVVGDVKKLMYIGPNDFGGFVFVERVGGIYSFTTLQNQAYTPCAQSWEGEDDEEREVTEEDVGSIVYDEDGNACELIGVDCGPFDQCVVSYGGDTLGWSSKCYIPKDQAAAEAEFNADDDEEPTVSVDTTSSNPCGHKGCNGKITINKGDDIFDVFGKLFGAKLGMVK